MRRTELLQEIRKMRFEEAYERWNVGRLSQAEAAQVLGICERSLRRYVMRYEAEGLNGLIDRRLEQVSLRRAPVDEVLAETERYRQRHLGWSIQRSRSADAVGQAGAARRLFHPYCRQSTRKRPRMPGAL